MSAQMRSLGMFGTFSFIVYEAHSAVAELQMDKGEAFRETMVLRQ